MKSFQMPYADTKRMSSLVIDHMGNEIAVGELRNWSPDLDGIRKAASARQFDQGTRAILCNALETQYAGIEQGEAVKANLELLRSGNALTVTTGHQLCLFTGPLYLPFKILNIVRLARTITLEIGRPVVPVFWMATEDHDRPEIDHAWFAGTKVQWNGDVGGPVGRLPLKGIDEVVQEAIALLGAGEGVGTIGDLLLSSYREDRTLSDATRRFVHGLFGRFGVICLDGDDPALKRVFAPVIREELVNQVGMRSIAYANAKLQDGYPIQAHAREINLFHMRPGHRARIVLDGDRYRVEHGPSFTVDELMVELEQHPERFSPNVLLRPVYQETILPNVAYVGGGGEVAYWLQLKWLFQAVQVPMPAIILRTGAAFIGSKHLHQWEELGLSIPDLFSDVEELKLEWARTHASFRTDMDAEKVGLNAIYNALNERVAAVDPSLKGAVEARRAHAMKGLDRIGKGMVRAAKREQQVAMDRIDRIHQALFPGGTLQERRDNLLPMIAARGETVLDDLLEILDPLDPRFTVMEDP